MKNNFATKYIQKLVNKSKLGSCLTICQLPMACLIALSLTLNACAPAEKVVSLLSGGGGTGDGGGGQGVLCKTTKTPALNNRLFVRDIYEAIYQKNTKMKSVPNDLAGTSQVSPEAIKILTSSLKAHYGPASHNLEFTKDSFWVEFSKKISFLDGDKNLFPSDDANSPIHLPTGCEVVQIAYWDESAGVSEEGTLYVKEDLWKKLDQLNKIGLLAHEYFFKQGRKALYKNSNSVRTKVGELLSEQGISPLFKQWVPSLDKKTSDILPRYKAGYKFCEGTSVDDPTAKIQFYQYTGADKKQHFTIPLLTSSTVNASFLSNTDFSFNPEKNPSLAQATDLLIYQSFLASDDETLDEDGSEELGDRRANWYPRWFGERGFVDHGLNYGSKSSLDTALYQLGQKKEIVWSDFLTSSTRPIKVSLINPASDKLFAKDLKIKSRDELILTTQKLISGYLNKCYIQWPTSDSWLAILNKEINDNIAAGTHPDKFPKWNEIFGKLDTSNCEREQSDLYSEALPSLLYSLKTNNYNARVVVTLLEEKALNLPNWNYLNPGRIRVTQDTNTVNFDLQCEDYETTYNKVTTTTSQVEPQIIPNKKVSTAEDFRLENQEEKDKIRNENLARLTNFLKFENGAENSERIKGFMANGVDSNCQSHFDYMKFTCDHLERFTKEVATEQEITVTNCPIEFSTWKPNTSTEETAEVCAMVKLHSTKHSYRIYFRFEADTTSEEPPSLTFVRFMGIEKPKDKWGNPVE